MRPYQHLLLSLLIAATFAPNSCDHRSRDLTFRDLARGDQKPKVIAAFQPWFGDTNHIQVGYNSNDPAVIHKQIEEAKSLGVTLLPSTGMARATLSLTAAMLCCSRWQAKNIFMSL